MAALPDVDLHELLRRPDVLDAVRSAAYHSETGPLRRHHDALVLLLRVADPSDPTLALLDRRQTPDESSSEAPGDPTRLTLGEDDERVLAAMRHSLAWRVDAGRIAALAVRYGGSASPVANTLRELVEAVDVAAADQELLALQDEDDMTPGGITR